jgi:hypothetical protein
MGRALRRVVGAFVPLQDGAYVNKRAHLKVGIHSLFVLLLSVVIPTRTPAKSPFLGDIRCTYSKSSLRQPRMGPHLFRHFAHFLMGTHAAQAACLHFTRGSGRQYLVTEILISRTRDSAAAANFILAGRGLGGRGFLILRCLYNARGRHCGAGVYRMEAVQRYFGYVALDGKRI